MAFTANKPVAGSPGDGSACSLQYHPDLPPRSVSAIDARLRIEGAWLLLRWRIQGATDLVVPPLAGKGRADGLWKATCFELFLRAPQGEGYCEFNLSPSERWAAYDFSAYRSGMAERPMPRDPVCNWRGGSGFALFDTAIPIAALPPLPWQFGLTAVIEEQGGQLSYWALAHPQGKPDFHADTCFAATLAAPGAA